MIGGRLLAWYHPPVPPRRLAALRLIIGGYALVYLVTRASHLNAVVNYPAGSFAPVGVVHLIDQPLSPGWVYALYAAAVGAGIAFTLGAAYRVSAPLFASLLLWVMSYRHSWGMIFHTDNLLVLHVLLLSFAPSVQAAPRVDAPLPPPGSPDARRGGWVVRAMCLVTVASYVVAGAAKLRHSGWSWAAGGALREQVAYDAIRKIELGSWSSPLGPWLVPHEWLFAPLSAFSLATELLAPLALLGVRFAAVWCGCAWLFHAGVLALMAIAFPYPLSGCAFAAFFPVERLLRRLELGWQRLRAPAAPAAEAPAAPER